MKFKSVEDFFNEKSKEFYSNECLTESAYRRLSNTEKREVTLHSALSEFVSLKDVMKDFYSKKMGDAERDFANMSDQNSRFFKDVMKSGGDFTKTEQYKNIQSLLSYSLEANDNNGKGINGAQNAAQVSYSDAAMVIRNIIAQLVSKSSAFKQAISREMILPLEKRYAFSTYLVISYLIYSTADVLYSSSLKANFDYNQKHPVATDIYFEYNGGMENQLQYMSYFSKNFAKGAINKLLSGTLTEKLDESLENVMVLNESVLDVIGKLVLDSWISDIVMLPIYLLRSMVYTFKYLNVKFTNMSKDIEDSIKLQRASYIGKDDYEKYKTSAGNKLFALSQATTKAETAIDFESAQDKKSLNGFKSNNVII